MTIKTGMKDWELLKSKIYVVMWYRMHEKYSDVLEYFRESASPKDVTRTVEEFQKFDETYQQMKQLNNLNFHNLPP